MIVGLVTSYREGRLVRGAVESLARGCDVVLVLEGPAPFDREALGAPSELSGRMPPNVIVRKHGGQDDADKRTQLVQWAQDIGKRKGPRAPLWLVWCDADEVLLWAEYLPDYIEQLERSADQNATGGFGLRHVEPDGSVHMSVGRVLNGHNVKRYLVSGYQVELVSGLVVALPLLPLCTAGGIPLGPSVDDRREFGSLLEMGPGDRDLLLAQNRPPLQGEPHTLHRHPLRITDRSAARMHDDEAEWFESATGGPHGAV